MTAKEVLWFIVGLVLGFILFPIFVVLGILAFLASPFTFPLCLILIAAGVALIILGVVLAFFT